MKFFVTEQSSPTYKNRTTAIPQYHGTTTNTRAKAHESTSQQSQRKNWEIKRRTGQRSIIPSLRGSRKMNVDTIIEDEFEALERDEKQEEGPVGAGPGNESLNSGEEFGSGA